ncbi:MAG: penicillin acylase family protein, partial [Caulobacterales bacterium]|nr:penicillin acylase family protein [Caulobacterales bacterium]
MPKWLSAGLLAVLTLSCAPTVGDMAKVRQPSPSAPEIVWDDWGVPHIYAAGRADAFYAFGWAQMHAHGELIARLYAQARGEAAAHYGGDYVESDQFVQIMDGPGVAMEWLAQQEQGYGDYLAAFAKGMNDYAAAHPGALSDEARSVLPVTASDPLAHVYRILHLKFIGGDVYRDIYGLMAPGSNALAVAPSRAEAGRALLLMNPHLPWTDYFMLMEAHIQDGEVNAYGAA